MQDHLDRLLDDILDLDVASQRLLRSDWPESWLQINLPLGSTRALLAIEAGKARTPGRVADLLGVSRTTITGTLDRLEAEGLLTRTVDPADRRCFVLEVTDKGRALVAAIDGHRRQHLRLALESMDPASLIALHVGLKALVASMRGGDHGHASTSPVLETATA